MRGFTLLLAVALCSPTSGAEVLPAIQKVVTMLENLVSMMESEGQEDEKKFQAFSTFCGSEKQSAGQKIEEMNTKIEDANAALTDLRAQKQELDGVVAKLNKNIDQEQSQVNSATEKRNEEKSAFNNEQMDFANAISACDKAVTLLGAHYGDGTEHKAEKPAWLSLANTYLTTVHKVAQKLSAQGRPKCLQMLQGKSKGLMMIQSGVGAPANEQYEESTGEAINIVDQVKVLSQTFAEDKASAREEEATLQKSFDNLIGKKNEILGSLQGERDTQQAQLNSLNQDIAEQEGALTMASEVLADRQKYLSLITKQETEMTQMFNQRKKDREDESKAVNEALKVLADFSLFSQTGAKGRPGRSAGLLQKKMRPVAPDCLSCAKAAAMLRTDAKLYHSAVLSAAAATTMGSDAIDDVVDNLKELVKRIKEEQKTEKEHKDWCDDETGLTTTKRQDHSDVVSHLTGVMADLQAVIKEKDIDLDEVEETIENGEVDMTEQTDLRKDSKEEYEEDVQDHLDAIQALNEAIEILANFYAKRKAGFVQEHRSASFLQKRVATEIPDGGTSVAIMSDVRKEFEQTKTNLDKEEKEAEEDFNEIKTQYKVTDADLKADRNTILVEEQTAEQQLDTAEHDKESNAGEVQSADAYLKQLGKSCFPLIMHFDERTKLRKEERNAIEDAVDVLRKAK